MNNQDDQDPHVHQPPQKSGLPSLRAFILTLIFVIIGYYLFTEHRTHVAGFLATFPWWMLLFLLCPLMHLFHDGHGGHSHHKGHHDKKNNPNSQEKDR